MYRYYWLEYLDANGKWEIENGYMTRSEAIEDKEYLIGRYAEWTLSKTLRNRDVRIRIEKIGV
mgnify:CR=1 FL=1